MKVLESSVPSTTILGIIQRKDGTTSDDKCRGSNRMGQLRILPFKEVPSSLVIIGEAGLKTTGRNKASSKRGQSPYPLFPNITYRRPNLPLACFGIPSQCRRCFCIAEPRRTGSPAGVTTIAAAGSQHPAATVQPGDRVGRLD